MSVAIAHPPRATPTNSSSTFSVCSTLPPWKRCRSSILRGQPALLVDEAPQKERPRQLMSLLLGVMGFRHHRRSYGCTPIIVSVQVLIAFSLCNIYITYRMENISTSWGFHPLYLLLSTFPICGSDVEEISCTVFSLYIMKM